MQEAWLLSKRVCRQGAAFLKGRAARRRRIVARATRTAARAAAAAAAASCARFRASAAARDELPSPGEQRRAAVSSPSCFSKLAAAPRRPRSGGGSADSSFGARELRDVAPLLLQTLPWLAPCTRTLSWGRDLSSACLEKLEKSASRAAAARLPVRSC